MPGSVPRDRGIPEREGKETGAARRWAVRGGQLVLTVAVTWFILDRVGITTRDLAALEDRWLRPEPLVLGVASVVFLSGLFLSAAFWGRMVKELGGPRVSFSRAAAVYFASNLGRYIPGKVWQLAGLAYLARKEGVSSATATAAAVLVQAVSLAGATVVGAWALATTPGVAGGWGGWAAGGILLAVAATTVPPVFERLLALWFRLAARVEPPDWSPLPPVEGDSSPNGSPSTHATSGRDREGARAADVGAGQGREGASSAAGGERGGLGGARPARKHERRAPGALFGVRWLVLFGLNWIVYAGSFWIMARSFGVDAGFLAVAPAFAAAYVLGYVMIFAPAGIGVREGFLVAFLQPSVGGATATALAVLARFWMTLLELLPALAFGGAGLLRRSGAEKG